MSATTITKKRKVRDTRKHSEANRLPEPKISIDFNANLETIQKFVNDGGDVNTSDQNGRNHLHFACYNNRLDIVSFLLSSGADINKLDNWGRNALEVASRIYQPAITLLEKGSKCTSVTDIILNKAALSNHIALATLYLIRLTPEGRDPMSISVALKYACRQSNIDMIKLLLNHGATFAEADDALSGLSCLYSVIHKNAPNCLEVVTLILDNGMDANGKPSDPIPALWRFCDTGRGDEQTTR